MSLTYGPLALFGSGEAASTGRPVHDLLVQNFPRPVKIGLVTAPAAFEANPNFWYGKLKQILEKELANHHPQIELISSKLPDGIDYIHAGAGSPTYAARIFKNSPLWQEMIAAWGKGAALSFASASAIAAGRFVLPVYEIYKAGHDLRWQSGLNLFARFGLDLTIVTHWNNQEGGREIDTSRCFMGVKRFDKLRQLLPQETTVVGIDEHTSLVFYLNDRVMKVIGKGGVILWRGEKQLKLSVGRDYPLAALS